MIHDTLRSHASGSHTSLCRRIATCLLLLLVIICAAEIIRADAYTVFVDTAGLQGTSGFINLQFNPGSTTAQPATALVTGFTSSGGTALGVAETIGNVLGVLPDTVSFSNTTQLNDLFQSVAFGSGFSFDVNLSLTSPGAAGGGAASEFVFGLFAADGVTPLLTTDAEGRLLSIQLLANDTTSAQTFDNPPSIVTAAAAAVPEPTTMVLLGTSLAGLAARKILQRSIKRFIG